ncbi:peptide MFS transporter [Actinomadura algeriensis]|uniref:POT family proton-dependent oligopeptide transporter n=1 Tax=Actinomadura algeriensis TaxID=1679523 RepID=A0ABR9JIW2_9ACTN|nr:peptide MFS transporter [Actinomadura algeriensis]MBE1530496.1 POT family proton-dependent oligopeptide transporter [Actinomadura algeriensis]
MPVTEPPSARPSRDGVRFRRQRWFVTLFLTDIWERFSFYGMQAILVLYAAAPVDEGGLGLRGSTAAMLFGVYVGSVFVLALPGGWVGDRVLGERRAVIWGGVIIALGHFAMAMPVRDAAYAGLALIAIGTGLLKPNMLALLSGFYPKGDAARREAAISIFYTGIQVSALLAPLITGFVGERIDWHLGFGLAGAGMVLGVVQFTLGRGHFGEAGRAPRQPLSEAERRTVIRRVVRTLPVPVLLVAVDVAAGTFSPLHLAAAFGLVTLIVPFGYTAVLLRDRGWAPADRGRLKAFTCLLLSYSLFWMLVSQAGSMLALFAQRSTDRTVAGFTVPAGWFQSAIPLFILVMAPVFAALWIRLGNRVGTPAKFALGLAFAGASFLLMGGAAAVAAQGAKVSLSWLLMVFFLQACGEIVIGPVAISTSAEVAPAAFVGRTIGLSWLFSALGAGLGAQVVHLADVWPDHVYYLVLGGAAAAASATIAVAGGGARRALAAPVDAP